MSVSARDRGLLLSYRLRPLEPPALVGAVLGSIAAGLFMIPAGPPAPPAFLVPADVTTPLAIVALALSLAAGFVGGRDVDAAERLLFSAPVPHRRAVALRLLLWGAVSAAIVWALGGRAEAALETGSHAVTAQALVYLLFATAVVSALARALGPLTGGGIALTIMFTLAGAPSFAEGFPLHVLAAADSPQWGETASRLIAISVVLLAATFWVLGRKGRT